MAYNTLNATQKAFLQEAARVAYGSGGCFERRAGGKGRMGILTDGSGKTRIVKFNTHSSERSLHAPATREMLESSNRLRAMLLEIAESARDVDLGVIRFRLGLSSGGKETSTSKLLDRSDVAAVVRLIGGDQVWDEALEGADMAAYASQADMRFSAVAERLRNRNIVQQGKTFDVLTDLDIAVCRSNAHSKISKACEQLANEGKLGKFADRRMLDVVTMDFVRQLAFQDGRTKADLKNFPDRLGKFIAVLPEVCPEIGKECDDGEIEKAMDILREGCRQALCDASPLLECGLDKSQVARLKEHELMPVDCLKVVKEKFPSLGIDELWQVAKAVSVYAAKDLSSNSETPSGIKQHLEDGSYSGLVFGAFFVQVSPNDLDRHLKDFVQTRVAKFGTCEEHTPGNLATRLTGAYKCAKKLLYVGKDEKTSWREFCKMIAYNEFELLRGSEDDAPYEAVSRVQHVITALDADDFVKCSDKMNGRDIVRVLAKVKDGTVAANGRLLAHFVASEQDGEQLNVDNLVAKIDGFWKKVTPQNVLRRQVDADGGEKAIFQLVAASCPEAGEKADFHNEIRSRYKQVMDMVNDVVRIVRGGVEPKITKEQILAAFAGKKSVENQRALLNAVGNQQSLDKLREVWVRNAQQFVAVSKEIDRDVFKNLRSRHLLSEGDANGLRKAFFGKDNAKISDLLLNDLSGDGNGFVELQDKAVKWKNRVEVFVGKFAAAVKEGDLTTKECRARRLASFVVLNCLLNAKFFSQNDDEQLTELYNIVYEKCKTDIVDQLDECSRILSSEETRKTKRQAIRDLCLKLGRFLSDSCFDYRIPRNRARFYGSVDDPGDEELQLLMHNSLLALLSAEPNLTLAARIVSTMGNSEMDVDPGLDKDTYELLSRVKYALKDLNERRVNSNDLQHGLWNEQDIVHSREIDLDGSVSEDEDVKPGEQGESVVEDSFFQD